MSVLNNEQQQELVGLVKGAVGDTLAEMGISQDKWFDAFVQKLNGGNGRKYKLGGAGFVEQAETLNERVGKILYAQKRNDHERLKSLVEGVAEDGGYLVPAEFIPELIKSIESEKSIRSLVRVLPVNRDKGTMPRQISGATLINVSETGTYRPATGGNEQPVFGQVAYSVIKYGGIIAVSNELQEDAYGNIGQIVTDAFAEAALATENLKMLTGAGTPSNEPLGIFAATAGYLTGAAATTPGYDDLVKAYYGIKAGYRRAASWLLNTRALAMVAKIKTTTNQPLFAPDPRQLGEFTILGHRVNVFDEIPVDEGKTSIAFGDWQRAYYFFDRRQLTVLTTNTGGDAFDTGTTETRVDERFDGKPADTKAAYVLTGASV